jgi:hypothetical protein
MDISMNKFLKIVFYLLIAVSIISWIEPVQLLTAQSDSQIATYSIVKSSRNQNDDEIVAESAIVRIKGKENGTGFIIAKNPRNKNIYIVTARHVITGERIEYGEDDDVGNNQNLTVQFRSKTTTPIEVKRRFQSDNKDIALLIVDGKKYRGFEKLPGLYLSKYSDFEQRLNKGDDVFTYGASIGEWLRKSSKYSGQRGDYFIFEKRDIIGGNSGGPFINQEKINGRWMVWSLIIDILPGEVRTISAPSIREYIKGIDSNIISLMEKDIPVVVATSPQVVTPPTTPRIEQITQREIEPIFYGFLEAWRNKQYYLLKSYLSFDFYYTDQKEPYQGYQDYTAEKERLFRTHRWIKINISQVNYRIVGDYGIVTYYQHYNTPTYESWGTNQFHFRKKRGQIKIFKEVFERERYIRK